MRSMILLAAAAIGAAAGHAVAAPVKIYDQSQGSFRTNISGEPNPRPPYVQVIRTAEGLDYMLARYERLKDRYTEQSLNAIRKRFGTIDFSKKMALAALSQPLDHFSMKLLGVEQDSPDSPIRVKLSYRHDATLVRRSGAKNIFYIMVVIPKSGQPALLEAVDENARRKAAEREPEMVTGVLMEFGAGNFQLVVEKTTRGKKSTYYIKEPDAEALKDHIGRKVTIQGYIKPEGLSAYEREITYLDLVKVF